MFHILFPSALWLWVHNKGSWMSDSTVLKLWKNNPDLELCSSFQLIQKKSSSIYHGSDRLLTWVFTVRRCHLHEEFLRCSWANLSTDSIYISQRRKKTVVFLTHPPVCVYMLSLPPVPADKSCPVCVFIMSMSVFKRTVPCPSRPQCLHKARLKVQKFLVFQGMRNTWGARFMR